MGNKVTELDNRGLEPPQPMIRTLKALEESNPGDLVNIHNDRVPMFLIEELRNLGYPFEVDPQTDGSAKISICKR
jgi:tRNA 2-thiouridine synthesizing protein A